MKSSNKLYIFEYLLGIILFNIPTFIVLIKTGVFPMKIFGTVTLCLIALFTFIKLEEKHSKENTKEEITQNYLQ